MIKVFDDNLDPQIFNTTHHLAKEMKAADWKDRRRQHVNSHMRQLVPS